MKEIFDRAVNFHKQNNFGQAEKIYKKLLVENPNNYSVLGNLALLEPFEISFPPDFEVYDPKILDKTFSANARTTGKKIFERRRAPSTE